MNKPTYVYVAGPITSSGSYLKNIVRALDVKHELIALGFIPFVPHEGELGNIRHMMSWEENLKYDEAWILKCDVLLRLSGDSKGADREIRWARKHKIPVVHSVGELLRRFSKRRRRNG